MKLIDKIRTSKAKKEEKRISMLPLVVEFHISACVKMLTEYFYYHPEAEEDNIDIIHQLNKLAQRADKIYNKEDGPGSKIWGV